MASGILQVPYMTNMQLGSTYNAHTNEVGNILVFNETRPHVVVWNKMETDYKVIKSNKEARDFLNVSSRLSLAAKSPMAGVNLGYSSGYLNETKSREDNVELLMKITYNTQTDSVSASTEPIPDWKDKHCASIERNKPTHYVRSIHYGGYMIVSFRFVLKDKSQSTKRNVEANVGGSFMTAGSADVGHTLEKAKESTDSISNTQLRYWTSVHTEENFLAQDTESLQKTLRGFEAGIKTSNAGKGIPLFVELVPLTFVCQGFTFVTNQQLEREMSYLEELCEEIQQVDDEMQKLYLELPEKETPFNLVDDVLEFCQEISEILKDAQDATDRINFNAEKIDELFFKRKDSKEETNKIITSGMDAYQMVMDGTYRNRVDKLKELVESAFSSGHTRVQVTMEYDDQCEELLVTVLQARDIPKDVTDTPDPYFKVTLSESKTLCTEKLSNTQNPVFSASRQLAFELKKDDMKSKTVDFDLYDHETIGSDNYLATARVRLNTLQLGYKVHRRDGFWLQLDRVVEE